MKVNTNEIHYYGIFLFYYNFKKKMLFIYFLLKKKSEVADLFKN